MEPENEDVKPTQSLFGGPVSITAPVPEDSSVGVDTGYDEPAAVEESVAVEAEPAAEPAVAEEEVSNEPEPASAELEEAVADVEVDTEAEAEPAPVAEEPEIAKLKAEREKLDAAILSKQLDERKSVISQIAAVVKLYDIPLVELFTKLGGIPNPRKGEKAPITHKDDQGNTWTGRGRTPRWLKDKNPDDYRV